MKLKKRYKDKNERGKYLLCYLFQTTRVKRQRLKPNTIAGKGVYFANIDVHTNTCSLEIMKIKMIHETFHFHREINCNSPISK